MSCEAVKLTITGVVQGVGFRPFVYREACSHQVTGWVLNTVEGVIVHAEGESDNIDAFILALSEQAPAAAQVKKITIKEVPLKGMTTSKFIFQKMRSHALLLLCLLILQPAMRV